MLEEKKGELTTRALFLLKTYLECGCSKAKTARKLDKSYQSVYQQLHQPYVRNIFKMLCLEKGITFGRLAQVLDEGLSATKVISATVIVNKNIPGSLEQDAPDVGEALANERTFDFIDVPDLKTRHKYLETALEVFDVLKYNVKVDSSGPQLHFYNIKQVIEDANRSNAKPDSIAPTGDERPESVEAGANRI
jgi:hypothetical protein